MEISLGRHASHNAGLDAAVILPAQNLESAMVAPVFAPGIGDQPERSAVLHTPTKNPDSMSAEVVSPDVLVDTAAVVGEVREDFVDCLHGPVLHKLHLNLPDVGSARHAVRLIAKGLVGLVGL